MLTNFYSRVLKQTVLVDNEIFKKNLLKKTTTDVIPDEICNTLLIKGMFQTIIKLKKCFRSSNKRRIFLGENVILKKVVFLLHLQVIKNLHIFFICNERIL